MKDMNGMVLYSDVVSIAGGEKVALVLMVGGGSDCPNGCSSIGWGMSKILECDCNYDHFSSCDRWGC